MQSCDDRAPIPEEELAMKRICLFPPLLVLLACPFVASQEEKESSLFPPARPFEEGYFRVDDVHELFYVCCGNPEGKPVMCLHGGPGAGCYPRMTQYFNPDKFLIVLHDQRGAGMSRPHGELKGNTTQNLVKDIEKLRKHLKLGKVMIFGGSWGTTLSLAYAETYPENVIGMLLRGVFLASEEEIEFHYMGTRHFYPAEHGALLSVLPDKSRGTHPDYLYELVTGDDLELRHKVLDALGRFELKFMMLDMPDERVDFYLKSMNKDEHFRYARLDLTYVKNRHFLEPGQLLRNIGRIRHLPVTLINGRYDMASPVFAAYKVHKALPKSKLIIVEKAGHSETEEGITEALVKAAAEFE